MLLWANHGVAACTQGNCENGHGTYIFDNGTKYVGMFRHGKKHGQGTITYANGLKYVGTWVKNKKRGRGTLIFKNGMIKKVTIN